VSGHLAFLLAYSAGLIALGVWIGRRVGTSVSFFVANRRLGAALLFATVLAANIGAGSTIGAAGLGYRDGLAAWWWVGSAGIGSLVLALWIGPRIWQVARDHDLYTVGDYLEYRYGAPVRAIIAGLLWVATLAILAGQLIALAWVLEVVADVPKLAGCLIGGVVMTVYFAAGGLVASAWVNLVQLVVLLVGFGVALPWLMVHAGGWDAIAQAAPSPEYLQPWRNGPSGWTYLTLLAPAFIISPGLLQKAFGARDERTLRLGLTTAAVALLVFAAVPPLLGMAARIYAPALTNRELALPIILTEGLPPWLGGLGLAAVFSAEVSSADAILFMLATSLSRDLYRRFVRPEADDRQVLRVARLAAVAGGALGVSLAVLLPSVIGALTIFYAVLGVSLFVPVVAGLTMRRPGMPEALAAIGAGTVVLVTARLLDLPDERVLNGVTLALLASALAFGLTAVRSKQ
jgi:SSS family solute:Na+ symporter